MDWYSWNSDAERFATVTGVTSFESLVLTPAGRRNATARLKAFDGESGARPLGDFPHTGLQHPRVLSSVAWRALEDRLSGSGDTMTASIEGSEQPFVIWYPSIVSDCLDTDASEIHESISGYRRLIRAVFSKSRVPIGVPFLVMGFEMQDVWVDGEFRNRIASSPLRGAQFRAKAGLS